MAAMQFGNIKTSFYILRYTVTNMLKLQTDLNYLLKTGQSRNISVFVLLL